MDILTPALIAAIVAAIVALWTTQKRISAENITQDRREWRVKVRENSLLVHDALTARDEKEIDRLRIEFRALLNPIDENDKNIIRCIKLPDEHKELELAEEFSKRISLLLKHDWDRVKLDTGPLLMKLKWVRCGVNNIFVEAKRHDYEPD